MKKLTCGVCALVLLLCGCAAPSMPEPLIVEAAPGVSVHYDNELVARALQVTNAKLVTNERLPKLVFSVRNLISERYAIEYQIEWRNEYGAPLQQSNAWLQAMLTGNAEKAVQSIGKSAEAKSAVIAIRVSQITGSYVPEADSVEVMRMQQDNRQQ